MRERDKHEPIARVLTLFALACGYTVMGFALIWDGQDAPALIGFGLAVACAVQGRAALKEIDHDR